MRTNFTRLLVLLASAALFSSSAWATNITAIDFSGWDSDVLSTNGGVQRFEDVIGDVDVTVTAVGEFDAPTAFSLTLDGTREITSSHDPNTVSECHGYVFAFSDAVDVLVTTNTLDAQEEYKITAEGSVNYTNESGVEPIVTTVGNMVTLDGVAFGLDPVTGASHGSTFIDAPQDGPHNVTISYCADATHVAKFGSFALSTVTAEVTNQSIVTLPEPSPIAFLSVGGLMMVLMSRRRRR